MLRFISTIALVITFFGVHAHAQEDGNTLSVMDMDQSAPIVAKLEQKDNSLYEALSVAYENNPTMRAARAEFKAVEEQLPQAQAGFKPTITADADITATDTETEGQSFVSSDGLNTSKSGALNVNQPLFRGGSTLADIKGAKNTITAQSLALSAVEQEMLYQAAEAYMNVLRDQAVLSLNENNYSLIGRELEQAQARFDVGELTKTDVSQSEARLAAARAGVITAQGDLSRAIATYKKIIGVPPFKNMAFPQTLFGLPKTVDEAISLAESNNRGVLQAKFINAAADNDVDSVYGELLPQVSAVGRLSKVYDPSDFIDEQTQNSIGVSASIPLYKAGSTRSRVREAKKRANQRYMQIIEATNNAREETILAWEQLRTAEAEIQARQSQIDAARVAREGVQYETQYGERTTLDALNANQALLDAQVNLVTAKRDEVVARFALGRAVGLLVPQNLGFSSINP